MSELYNALWIGFALAFPLLVAYWALDHLAPADFKNPGGWKLPKGEAALLGSWAGGFGFVVLIDVAVNL